MGLTSYLFFLEAFHFQGNNVTIPDATFDLIEGPNALDSSRSRVMFCNESVTSNCVGFESEMAKRAIYFAIIGAITLSLPSFKFLSG